MTEKTSVEDYLKKRVERDLGGWCVKLVPWYQSGLPDRLCFLPGARIELVETKWRKGTLRKTQKGVKRRLERLGFTVWVLNSRQKVDRWVDWIQNRNFN